MPFPLCRFENSEIIEFLSPKVSHHLPVIVIGEYRAGILDSKMRRKLTVWFERLIRQSVVLNADLETSARCASTVVGLKRKGVQIPTNDIWIAALAQQHGLPIVTNDAHFDHIPDILCVTW